MSLIIYLFIFSLTGSSNGDEEESIEASDLEQELQRMIQQDLGECSRQRLRALQMALRRQGNMESRISAKDLYVVLQVCVSVIVHGSLVVTVVAYLSAVMTR